MSETIKEEVANYLKPDDKNKNLQNAMEAAFATEGVKEILSGLIKPEVEAYLQADIKNGKLQETIRTVLANDNNYKDFNNVLTKIN